MKTSSLFFTGIFLIITLFIGSSIAFSQNVGINETGNTPKPSSKFFVENKGQVKDQHWQPRPDILFSGKTNGLVYHLKKDGLHYQLSQVQSRLKGDENEKELEYEKKVSNKTNTYRVDVNWLNTNPDVQIVKEEELSGSYNYYNVPTGIAPVLAVKDYKKITYKEIYKGIDLQFFYNKEGELEYDFIVHPEADPRQIKIEIKGAEIDVDNDALVIKTPFGEITEGALRVYQGEKEITANWQINGNYVSFDIPEYNPAYALRIDPPVRVWGTYYGDIGEDSGFSTTTDSSGNVFLGGWTSSTTTIATVGAHQTTLAGGNDAFLVKFDNNGVRLWSTYYGGNNDETTWSCVTDDDGNIFLAGQTLSTTNIATPGAHQVTFGGGANNDCFLVKFNGDGIRQWGTYYGGSGMDDHSSCSTDSDGNVFVAGRTSSTTAIATVGAHQTTLLGGNDAYLVKFNSSGVRQWGTYYGGSNADFGLGCATDSNGNVFLSGRSHSTTGIATAGAHQVTHGGGGTDAFLAKFDSTGVRQWGTYYGGTGDDRGRLCATDNNGNVFLSGFAASTNAIATAGAHQVTHGGGVRDAFLVKFDDNGTRQWGTYYGGSGEDDANFSCITDDSGNVFITGVTSSLNAIATDCSYQTTHGGGTNDAFLVKFDVNGTRQWGTYYGGSGNESGAICATDNNGNVYISGSTSSVTALGSTGSHQETHGGGTSDGFLVKFEEGMVLSLTSSVTDVTCNGESDGVATITPSGGVSSYSYSWDANTGSQTDSSATGLSAGTYTVIVTDESGCVREDTVIISEPDTLLISIQTENVSCPNLDDGQIEIQASGGVPPYQYSIDGGINFQGNGLFENLTDSTYEVTVTDSNGCEIDSTITLTIDNPLPSITAFSNSPVCESDTIELNASGGDSYSWVGPGSFVSTVQSPIISEATTVNDGIYEVTVTDSNGCSDTAMITVTVNTLPEITFTSNSPVCEGDDLEFGVIETYPSYDWTGPNAFVSTDQNNTITSSEISNSGAYEVTVTDTNGCSNTMSTSLEVLSPPTASINGEGEICEGETITLTASGGDSYEWNTGATDAQITVSPSITTTYTVIVTVGSCSDTATAEVIVTPSPVASISGNLIISDSESSTLTASPDGATSYSWSPAEGLSCTDCQTTEATPLQSTTYCVIVTDANSCSDSTCVNVEVDFICDEIFIPTIFSPNGDGNNDFLCVLGDCIGSMQLEIFTRWGEKVFTAQDQTECWDGTFRGEALNTGVFVYKLRVVLTNGQEIEGAGNINLVK